MITTDKYSCRYLAAALRHYGVRRVVVSPGSRNAPMIVALARVEGLDCKIVIDERSAAFVALGLAITTAEPVAILCTSGSAALNYGPALAEAFYRRVPIIAITADRPEEWIDQDDSQTIRQAGSLNAVVKGCFDIPVCRNDEGLMRLVRHRVCDAIALAVQGVPGPVHINLQIDEPLQAMTDDSSDSFSFPEIMRATPAAPSLKLPPDARVMVLAGFMPPDSELDKSLQRLPNNCIVLCDWQSNLRGPFVNNIDATLRNIGRQRLEQLVPDIVITIGGSLLSRHVKTYLRNHQPEHWAVGLTDHCIDPLLALSRRIECTPADFFSTLSFRNVESDYKSIWIEASRKAKKQSTDFALKAPWSDFAAMHELIGALPSGTCLHLSNGTAVRYAQFFPNPAVSRIECNRGVSGIDGCTSTAIGAAMATTGENLNVLITGDMCAQYDMGALAITDIPANFRMAVLNNGGGGIFRFIRSTRDLPEMERYMAADVRLPLRQLAEGFGFRYYEASDLPNLKESVKQFFKPDSRPAILNIITPPDTSAQTIRNFFANKQ